MKKFTKGEQNLAKKWSIDLSRAFEDEKLFIARNPFSGAEVKLNTVEADLYSQVTALYQAISCGASKDVREYDRLKYLFLKINSKAYMALID